MPKTIAMNSVHDDYRIFENVLEYTQGAFSDLCKLYYNETPFKTRLIIPSYSAGEVRISEQEMRFSFVCQIEKQSKPFHYSVETPTSESYKFLGKNGRSASTDLTLYDDHKIKLANVEFKAHNPAPAAVNKDIEKLCKEGVPGAWIHLFKNMDRGTVIALFNKIQSGILMHGVPKSPFFLAIGVLEKKLLIARKYLDPKLLINKSALRRDTLTLSEAGKSTSQG